MNKGVLIGTVAAVVFGGAGFWGGMHYAQSSAPTRGQFAAGAGFVGRGGARGGAGATFGTIVSKDSSSITVQLMTGSSTVQNETGSKIVFFDTSTQIGKFTAGSGSDLSVGQTVSVSGTANSDGSITAQSIQIRPAGQGPRGGQ